MVDVLPPSLQESILAALIFDERAGAAIAAQVTPRYFDETYHEIAERVLEYRRKYGRGPGVAHLDDLFDKQLQENNRPSRVRRLLTSLAGLAPEINADYVVSRTQHYVREQQLKAALVEANARWEQGGEARTSDIEGILHAALRFRAHTLDAGTFLNDIDKSLRFLDRTTEDGVSFGIKEFDQARLALHAKEMTLYIAPKGCLVGETLVDCPRNLRTYPKGVPIQNLVGTQFLTYSWDFKLNTLVLSRVLDVWKSGRKPVYRVELSAFPNGAQRIGRKGSGSRSGQYLPPQELVGTYDHLVLLCDNTWKKLGELKSGDSLKSLYRSNADGRGYINLRWSKREPTVQTWSHPWDIALKIPVINYSLRSPISEHQFVCGAVTGFRQVGADVHHKDHNNKNNSPENLLWLNGHEHKSYHTRQRNLAGTAGWKVTGKHPRGMEGKRHSTKTKDLQRLRAQQITAGRQRNAKGHFSEVNHKVLSVEYLGVCDVYDMEVEGTENFVANGVFVHNSGKTWAAVHVGKQALLARKRVLHITNEVSEELTTQRYFQALFTIATSPAPYLRARLELDDDLNKLIGLPVRKLLPKRNFASPDVRKELRRLITPWGTRFGRLVVKEFPSGTLTVPHLEAYLDYLEQEHKFQPNVLIIDYPDLMAQDSSNYRISLGRTFVDVRGILVDRKMAGFFPTQGNRSSLKAEKVRSDMVSEDISKINTADIVLTYSRTEGEKERGLARLHVAHARNNSDAITVILTQSYATGQYVLESFPMVSVYWELLQEEPDE
jgi:hypothetical protein